MLHTEVVDATRSADCAESLDGFAHPEEVLVDVSLQELLAQATRVAPRNIPVLVTGETGVGKEVFVRRFHELTGRRGPLQVVNCAALPPELSESLLFGHERGAFTSASRGTVGLIAKAHQGTLFLDEIGELPARGQAALLRVLQEGHLLPVGSTCERAVDVRMVAATHCDLDAMTAAGSFRSDLLYRLNAVVFRVPPLRERREEIPELARLFVRLATSEWAMRDVTLTAPAIEKLQAHSWPGNIRELRHVMRRTVALLDSQTAIDVAHLPPLVGRGASSDADVSRYPSAHDQLGSIPLRQLVQNYEAGLIAQALRDSGGNVTLAAQLLRLPVRTLSYKLRLHAVQAHAGRPRGYMGQLQTLER